MCIHTHVCICLYASKADEWVSAVWFGCLIPLKRASLLQQKAIRGAAGTRTHTTTIFTAHPVFVKF